jgi:hypothetical protein
MTDTTDAREQRRAANRAQFKALNDAYQALPIDRRDLMKAEFAKQRDVSPTLSWARFLEIALPLLPAANPN